MQRHRATAVPSRHVAITHGYLAQARRCLMGRPVRRSAIHMPIVVGSGGEIQYN
jgi:hypothetical protein